MYVTRTGNEHLDCFGGDPERVIEEMRQRFGPGMTNKQALLYVYILYLIYLCLFIFILPHCICVYCGCYLLCVFINIII